MKRYVFGLVLIALGIMSFLQSSGQFYFGLSIWPVVLTLLGGAVVWGSLQRGWGPAWVGIGLGLWVGCIGLFGILSDAGVTGITGAMVARLGWPIVLVALGISIVAGRWHNNNWGKCHQHGCWHGSGIGDRHHGRESWTLDGDLELNHGIGDFILDLTTAEITDGLHRIKVGASIGELLIRVPGDVDVTIDAAVSVGELVVLGEERSGLGGLAIQRTVKLPEARVELRIEARLRVGELTVEQVAVTPRVTS